MDVKIGKISSKIKKNGVMCHFILNSTSQIWRTSHANENQYCKEIQFCGNFFMNLNAISWFHRIDCCFNGKYQDIRQANFLNWVSFQQVYQIKSLYSACCSHTILHHKPIHSKILLTSLRLLIYRATQWQLQVGGNCVATMVVPHCTIPQLSPFEVLLSSS